MPTITIVAKTGLSIETRVIHMASPRRGQPRRACGRAVRAAAAALTIAGAPSFRLSKRAASTGVPGGSGVLDLDATAVSSRRPVATMRRRACRPRSSTRTTARPRCARHAAGSVGVGAARRERDAAGREHSAAQRRIGVRDADVDEDRARAGLGRWIDAIDAAGEAPVAEAIDESSTGMPMRQLAGRRSPAPAPASRDRSGRRSSRAANRTATFSPGCTWRLATMPDSGDDDDRRRAARCARSAPAPRRT